MKERPIIFSEAMVRAILEGRKTQTRRIIMDQPSEDWHPDGVGMYAPTCVDKDGEEYPGEEVFGAADEDEGRICPYGTPGDRLWVRESTVVHASIREQLCGYMADGCRATKRFEKNMSSIHMRRAHCRIFLEITEVRVQRLQDISDEDCAAEGASWQYLGLWWTPGATALTDERNPTFHSSPKLNGPRGAYGMLWESINGAGSWNTNPWVWALTFKRVANG